MSFWKSCSRDQVSLTGLPTCLAMVTAWATKSDSNLRPNPPPRKVVWTVIRSGESPVIAAAVGATKAWPWVGAQISQASAVTEAVQLSTSMQAWAM